MIHFSIELTSRCNFKCVHCYTKSRTDTIYNLSLDIYSKILACAKKQGALFLTLTGGEPLLLTDFSKYYEYAINEGFIVSIFSNMSILKKDILHVFKRFPPQQIEISIYGMSNETFFDVTRCTIDYTYIFQNVLNLLNNNISIMLKYVVMQNNYHEISEFVEWAESKKVPYTISVANLPVCINAIPKHIDTSFRITSHQLSELSRQYPSKLKILSRESKFSCDLGEFFHITSSGIVQGCPALYESNSNLQRKFDSLDWDMFVREQQRIKECSHFCPAWERLEGQNEIERFLYQD